MKKKTTILMIMLALLASVHVKAQTLVLHHPDGTTTDVELITQPHIEFVGGRILITSTVLNMDYAKEDVLCFTYKGSGTDGVKAIKKEIDYSQHDEKLVLHGISQRDKVAVYTTNGVRVPACLIINGTDATLSLNAIPKGVYLLTVNGRTSKFTKQ